MARVLVFSGGIGSERSKLSQSVAQAVGWKHAKFSDVIRRRLEKAGEDATRSKLQSFGQDIVQNDLKAFVAAVLEDAEFAKADGCVIDGLRHIEVLLELREQAGAAVVDYVHVNEDLNQIEQSAEERGIEEQNLFRYNHALSEAQVPRILPAYANLELDASDGLALNTGKVLRRFGLKPSASAD